MNKPKPVVCEGCKLKRNCSPSQKDSKMLCQDCQLFEDIANSNGMYDGKNK